MFDFCQVCRHYDIVGNKCSKAPKRAIPKSKCADFENKANIYKRMEYEKKEWLCARCANQCKANGGMDYCEEFIDKEDAARTDNANMINALRKRCEEFMHDIVRDFGELLIIKDTAEISETERKKIDWNKEKQIPYTDKSPFIDFSLKFTVYNKD